MKLSKWLKNCEFKMRWFRIYIIWIRMVMILNFAQLLSTFVIPYSLYDTEYVVLKAIINAVIVVLFYITYRYLVILKRTGYALNNCLIFASVIFFSIGFALDSYYTSFDNRYYLDSAFGCFWLMFIPYILFWSLPNFIYFYKRREIFTREGILVEQSVGNSLKIKKIKVMETKENKLTESNEQVAFCRKCGTQLLIDSVFCNKCGAKIEQISKNYDVCIFDTTTHTLRKEKKTIDVTKFPPSKFADNDTYYAIETFRDGKKVRIYHTKDNWNKQIEIGISEEEK